MSSDRPNISLTALLIGVPVLVGVSCYYYYATRQSSTERSNKDKKSKKKQLSLSEQVMQLKQTGNHNFSNKNYDVAIEHYTKAIQLAQDVEPPIKPDDLAIFYQNRAACNEALGKHELVVEDCDRAIELKKTYIKAYLRRAKAFDKLKNYDKAMVDAFSANLLEKFQNQNSILLSENIVKASSKVKAAEAMMSHKHDWPSNQTIKAYFSAFTQDPIKQHLQNNNIKSYDQLQGLYDEASKPENDNDPFHLLVLGSCLSLMSNMSKAQECFDKLLDMGDDVCSAKIKANALIKKSAVVISDPSTAMSNVEKELEIVNKLLDKAAEIDPENPDIYLHKAQSMTLSEKLEEAIQALDKAIELKPDFHSAIAQKLYIELKMSTRDSSNRKLYDYLDKFKEATKEHPESQDLLQMYAQVLTEVSLFEQADETLLKLTKLDPTDGSVYVSRALLQFHLKSDPDEVAILLNEALRIDPKIIFAYEILGSIESQRGRADEAIKIFETALKYAQSENEYARCFSLLDSAKCQKEATDRLGMQM